MVGSRVYVGGLPYGVRERDLERFFKGYGRTREILIKNGYGFVVRCGVVVVVVFALFARTARAKVLISICSLCDRNSRTTGTPTMQCTS